MFADHVSVPDGGIVRHGRRSKPDRGDKQAVRPLLDGLAGDRIAHAVNCVVRTDTGWFGHNTDGLGFLESARQVIDLTGLEVLVVGSGGAAHAIAIEVVGIDCREHPPLDGVRPDTSVMRIVLDGALALA